MELEFTPDKRNPHFRGLEYKVADESLRNTFWLSVLVLAAIVTRFAGLGTWAFEVDEIFTLRDAAGGYLQSTKPAMYFLVDITTRLFGLSEFTVRLPSALLGVAGILAFYLLGKRFIGGHASAFGSIFLLLSSWHLAQSQFARFYSAMFLFGVLSYFLYYESLEKGKVKWLIAALLCNGLGMLFHTTFMVVPFSLLLFSLIGVVRKKTLPSALSGRIARIHLAIVGALGILVAIPLAYKVLENWMQNSSDNMGGWGVGGFSQALAVIKYVTVPVTMAAAAGFILLIRRDHPKGIFLGVTLGVPMAFILVGSNWMDMRPDYIIYALPLFFILAGYLCRELWNRLHPDRMSAIFTVLLIGTLMLPGFISHYSGKMTLDVRDAVKMVQDSYQEGDKILAFHPEFHYYLNQKNLGVEFVDWMGGDFTAGWDQKLKLFEGSTHRLWIILITHRNSPSPSLERWLYQNTALFWQKHSIRYDYSYDRIQIYLKK